MNVKYYDAVYSFRVNTSFIGAYAVDSPDATTLAQIEVALVSAATLFYQQRYRESIDEYKLAGAMIYRYLDPQIKVISPGLYDIISKDPRLFEPLLSVAAEHMNVLPIPTPDPIRPRIEGWEGALGNYNANQTGIKSSVVQTPAALSAVSDILAATHYRELGQTATATFHEQRALKADKNTAETFKKALEGDSNGAGRVGQSAPSSSRPSTTVKASGQNTQMSAAPRPVTIDVFPPTLPSNILEERTLKFVANRNTSERRTRNVMDFR